MAIGFSRKAWFWVRIILVVAVILFVFRMLFVNRPQPVAIEEKKISYTTGSIVNSVVEVRPGEYVSYPLDLNKRWRLKGSYTAANVKRPVGILVLDKENFERYKNGEEIKATISTGNTPGGRVDQDISHGEYFLVFDGRKVKDAPASVSADFYLE